MTNKLSDADRDELIQGLRNGTQMGRFNPSEIAAILNFIEHSGYLIAKPDNPEPLDESRNRLPWQNRRRPDTNAAPEGDEAEKPPA